MFLVDAALLICAYTDITVYFILPFALLRYLPQISLRHFWSDAKSTVLKNRTAQSLVAVAVGLLPQLYIVHHDGIPVIPGYLSGNFNYHRVVEIFISRSYLYDVLFPFNKHLSDTVVVAVFLLFIAVAWRYARGYRQFFVFGMLAIFAGTFLFVVKRTGIDLFYTGYKDSGPDQFFYTQSWIFSFIFVVVLADLISKIKLPVHKIATYVVIAGCIIFLVSPYSKAYSSSTPVATTAGNPHASNTIMATTVGTIYANAQKVCTGSGEILNLPIYPRTGWYYNGVTRQQLCA